VLESLHKNVEAKQEERLAHLQDKALTRMTQVLDDESLVSSHPFAVFDRSVTVLKGTGVLKSENQGGINAKNAVFVGNDLIAQLLDGIKVSDEARRLNAAPVEAVDVTTED
jgi:hypothetical protein